MSIGLDLDQRCGYIENQENGSWCNYRPGFGGLIPTEAVLTGDKGWRELVNADASEKVVQCSAEGIVAELECYARILTTRKRVTTPRFS